MKTFLVVYKIGNYFTEVRNAIEIRGVKPEEMWFFGEPFTAEDKEINAAARAAAATHGVVWHEIPR